MGLQAYHDKEQKTSIKILSEDYPKTYLDPSFQRLGGYENGSGWPESQCENYIGNLIEDRTINLVVRADVEFCLMNAIADGDIESQEYFQDKKDKGYSFVSIDGNNTSSSVYHFVEKGMKARDHVTGKKKKLSDYDRQKQLEIVSENKITVHTLQKISYRRMCTLFRDVNQSEKLNPQEFRQAQPTKLSSFVREVSNKE